MKELCHFQGMSVSSVVLAGGERYLKRFYGLAGSLLPDICKLRSCRKNICCCCLTVWCQRAPVCMQSEATGLNSTPQSLVSSLHPISQKP